MFLTVQESKNISWMQSHLYKKKWMMQNIFFNHYMYHYIIPLSTFVIKASTCDSYYSVHVSLFLYSRTVYSKPTCKELPITVKSVHSPNPKCFESWLDVTNFVYNEPNEFNLSLMLNYNLVLLYTGTWMS